MVFFFTGRGEKNFHIFYYIYAGLYHQDSLKKYTLPDKKAPRFVTHNIKTFLYTIFACIKDNMMLMVWFILFRYIDSANGKVMQDIVSNKLYKDQFDAIQDCFRIIGFSEEVRNADWLNELLRGMCTNLTVNFFNTVLT